MIGWLLLIAGAFVTTGALLSWWGSYTLDLDIAYPGVLFIFIGLVLASLTASAWLYTLIT